jgi:hypothetical protein
MKNEELETYFKSISAAWNYEYKGIKMKDEIIGRDEDEVDVGVLKNKIIENKIIGRDEDVLDSDCWVDDGEEITFGVLLGFLTLILMVVDIFLSAFKIIGRNTDIILIGIIVFLSLIVIFDGYRYNAIKYRFLVIMLWFFSFVCWAISLILAVIK